VQALVANKKWQRAGKLSKAKYSHFCVEVFIIHKKEAHCCFSGFAWAFEKGFFDFLGPMLCFYE